MTSYEYDNPSSAEEDDLEKTLLQTAVACEQQSRLSDSDSPDAQSSSETEPVVQDVKTRPVPAYAAASSSSYYQPARKRTFQEPSESTRDERSSKVTKLTSDLVAQHYNTIERGLEERAKSKIFHLRNFNNWVKSMLINEYLSKIRENGRSYNSKIKVLDLCCGKGGDLQKWRKGNIAYLICCDIADVSIKECEQRYNFMSKRLARNEQIFQAEFITADVSRANIRKLYKDKLIELDLVSCQFSFHYSFESLPQVECILQNVSECLKPGGYFIGTIPNAYELVARAHRANSATYGNAIYQISFDCDVNDPPLFGAKYDFFLEDAVNCPEFLVYFPLFVKLAKKFGLKLVAKENFSDLFNRLKYSGRGLLQKMNCLETYSSSSGTNFDKEEYDHAESYLKEKPNVEEIGTLSKAEWEATTLYLTFAFEKQKRIAWDKDGKPVYPQ